jgi:hypothetical protein
MLIGKDLKFEKLAHKEMKVRRNEGRFQRITGQRSNWQKQQLMQQKKIDRWGM